MKFPVGTHLIFNLMRKGSKYIFNSHFQHFIDNHAINKIFSEGRKAETFNHLPTKSWKYSLTIFQGGISSPGSESGTHQKYLFPGEETPIQPGKPVQNVFEKCRSSPVVFIYRNYKSIMIIDKVFKDKHICGESTI